MTCSIIQKKVNRAPHNYATHQHEVLAIFVAIKKWRQYIDGNHKRVITNHWPLTYLPTKPHLSPQQVCWMEFLVLYKLAFEYCPGPEAAVPDAFSWLHSVVLEPSWLERVSHQQHVE